MQRSRINQLIADAERRFADAGLYLPEWAHWTPADWEANAGRCAAIFEARLGWDLTDFGRGDFQRTGLLLFTVRNGTPRADSRLPYAEKLMLVGDRQLTPSHFHWSKTEDIINRGGGRLVLELHLADRATEQLSEHPFRVWRDGIELEGAAGMRVELSPGQSITLTPYLYHSFWAEGGSCIVGEVSSVNDDATDNRFLEAVGRFPAIEEDTTPQRLLCTDYGGVSGG